MGGVRPGARIHEPDHGTGDGNVNGHRSAVSHAGTAVVAHDVSEGHIAGDTRWRLEIKGAGTQIHIRNNATGWSRRADAAALDGERSRIARWRTCARINVGHIITAHTEQTGPC